jgi:type II secretory pathway pseudopilin PulG
MVASASKKRGQSLVEILIAMTIGALIVASAAGALVFTVRSNQQNRSGETASSLAQELLDNVRSVSQSDWQGIYSTAKWNGIGDPCPAYCYYLSSGGSPFIVASGSEVIGPINGATYTRYFTVENVSRDNCGRGNITSATETSCDDQPGDVLEDPSTQKVTAKVIWSQGNSRELTIPEYVTRNRNEVTQFTDWSSGPGIEGPFERPNTGYSSQTGLDTITIPGSVVLP